MQHFRVMLPNEVRATGQLAGTAVGGTAEFIREAHAGIAGRPFGLMGPLAAPVRVVHDAVAERAYRLVARALAAGPTALARVTPGNGIPLADTLRGSMALGALNGAIGDRLARDGNPLALDMTVRLEGPATPRLGVFVHGLCETDDAWSIRKPSYGTRLHEELGYSALYVRYNSGLHISDNGRRLAALLEETVADWPVPVEEIALVGHSMGGLVARSACHYGDSCWTRHVRHVFCLGSPHLGAPLEKGANALGYALARLPETRPLANVMNGRSVGIKDLRFGSCAEEDWCDCDPDEYLRDRCTEVPFLECATYYFVGATLTRRQGSLVGDLLVQFPSASGNGRKRRLPFEVDNGMHVPRANHFQLLNHPAVYEQLVSWIRAGRESGEPSSPTPLLPQPPGGRGGPCSKSSRASD
jgi:pimeloyl-ACP methyl ester carboxylesterase